MTLTLSIDPARTRPGFVLVRHREDGTMLVIAPRPRPFAKFARQWGEVKRLMGLAFLPAVVKAAADMDRQLAKINAVMRGGARDKRSWANDPVRLAGLEGRWYVYGGLDPAYATPAALDQLIRGTLAGELPDTGPLTPESRRALAGQAMAAYAVHRRPVSTGPSLVWHRALGTTRLQVVA